MMRLLRLSVATLLCAFVLQASFAQITNVGISSNVNRDEGCGSVLASLTCTATSPNSPIVDYRWDFGTPFDGVQNGPSATVGHIFLHDPANITRTVRVTVTNAQGDQVSATYNISVYSKPNPDFAVSPATPNTVGCAPLCVQFIDQSVVGAGSSNIISWKWASGGGSPNTVGFPSSPAGFGAPGIPNPTFCYDVTGNYAVVLTVTDNRGCNETISKLNAVRVTPTPKITISSSQPNSCSAPFTASIISNVNTYSAPGVTSTIQYGDSTAGVPNPPVALAGDGTGTFTHTYTNPGSYTITAITKGTNGCSDTLVLPNYINVGRAIGFNFSPTNGCVGLTVDFTSPVGGTQPLWDFGDGVGTSALGNPSYTYTTAGTYFPKLDITLPGGCRLSKTSTIPVVITNPPVANFTLAKRFFCAAATPTFSTLPTIPPGGSISWNFGGVPQMSNPPVPPTYNPSTVGYPIVVTVTDNNGCAAIDFDTVYVERPVARFALSQDKGCAPYTTTFNITGLGNANASTGGGGLNGYSDFTVNNYRWYVDGVAYHSATTAAAALPPAYTFQAPPPCTHDIKLVITNTEGCKDSITKTIKGSTKPVANFTFAPGSTCAQFPVIFNATTSTQGGPCPIDKYNWYYGDGTSTETNPSVSHIYKDTALIFPNGSSRFKPWLIVESNGCKSDTFKQGRVVITPAIAKFKVEVNCNNRLCVVLHATDNAQRSQNSIGTNFSWAVTRVGGGAVPSIPSATFPGGNTNPTVCFPSSGTYNVTLTVTDGASCSQTATAAIVIANPVPAMSPMPLAGCTPFTVNFNSTSTDTTSIASYLWSVTAPPGTFTINNNIGNKGSVVFTTPGSYTNPISLRITDLNGCQQTFTMNGTIDVRGSAVSFTTTPVQGCVPATVTVQSTSVSFPSTTTITNWEWDWGANGLPTLYDLQGVDNGTFTVTNPGPFMVKLVVTNSLGCVNSITTTPFTGYGPSAIMSGDTIRCTNKTLRFKNNSFGQSNLNYLWSFPGANVTSSTLQNPTSDSIRYATEGFYNVCLTVSQNSPITCTASSCYTIHIADPKADFIADTTESYCPPLLVRFTNQSRNATSYVWICVSEFGDTIANSSALNTDILYTNPGKYTVSLLAKGQGGCSDQLIKNKYIKISGPAGSYRFTPASGCTPLDVQFEIYNIRGANNLAVDPGDGSAPVNCPGYVVHVQAVQNIIETVTHRYTCAGIFNPFIILQDNNGCTATLDLGLKVTIDSAQGWTNVRTTPICKGDTAQLHAAALDPTATYRWFVLPNRPPPNMSAADITSANPRVGPLQNTTYYVEITTGVAPLLCVKRDSVIVPVKPFPLPVVTFDRSNVVLCQGTSVIITASGQTPADPPTIPNPIPITNSSAYVWNSSVPGLSNYVGLRNPIATPLTPSTYTVTVTDNNGCSASNSIFIDVLVSNPELLGPDRTICAGGSVSLPIAPGYTRPEWRPAIGLSCTSCPNPIATPTRTQKYYIALDNAIPCRVFDSITVYVIPRDSVSAGPDKFVCLGSSVQLNGRVPINPNSAVTPIISWSPADATPSNVVNPNVMPTAPAIYTMTYTNDQCIASDDVQVEPKPSADVVSADETICAGDSVRLLAAGAANTFTWSPGNTLSNPNIANPLAYPTSTTVYTVVASLGGNCATASTTVRVNVNQAPTINITPRGGTFFKNKPVQIAATTNGVSPTFTWTSLAADAPPHLSCYNCYNPVFVTSSDQPTYNYELAVSDANGCTNKAPLNLRLRTVCEPDQVFIPNAFSPNGDGQNDVLFVRGSAINGITIFRIFDRWGTLMFETNDIYKGWDGNYNGKPVSPDVYVYYVEAPCVVGGDPIFVKGNVTVTK